VQSNSETLVGLTMLFTPGDVVELRAFRKTKNPKFPQVVTGFYDSVESLAKDLTDINQLDGGTTVYVTINPVRRDWQTVNNKAYAGVYSLISELEAAGDDPATSPRLNSRKNLNTGQTVFTLRTTEDGDISRRRWILIDIDAGQPTDTNSSDEEKAAAKDKAFAVQSYLTSLGFPQPALCDSGNGYHVLVRCDLPNDDISTLLIQRFLNALAESFADGAAHVDTGVFNAARITKAYGTFAYKGAETVDRPHRQSRVISVGDATVTPVELITQVAAEWTAPLASTSSDAGEVCGDEEQQKQFDILKKFLTERDVLFDTAYTNKGSMCIPVACPNVEKHTTSGAPSETIVTVRPSGAFGFDCKHGHCQHLDWHGFKALVESRHKEVHPQAKPFAFTSGIVTVGKKQKTIAPPADSEEHTVAADGINNDDIKPIVTSVDDMPDSCLDGVLGDICQKRLSRFPRGFGWLALVTAAGTLVPRHASGTVVGKGDDRAERTNLYTALVGDANVGKSSCIDQAIAALGLPPSMIESKVGSGEGLMSVITKPDAGSTLVYPDELLHTLEKANILNSSLSTVLTTAFYKDEDGTVTKDTRIKYHGRMSLIGGILPSMFGKGFGSGSVGGLYDRFAFAQAPTGSRLLYRPVDKTVEAIKPIPVPMDADVWEWRDAWVKANPDVSTRVIEIAMRIAYICACYDHRPLRAKDMGPAIELAKYQAGMRELLKPNEGVTLEGQVEEAIASWMKRYASDGRWVWGKDLKDGIHAYRRGLGFRIYRAALTNLGQEGDFEVVIKGQQTKLRLLNGEGQ
jgi:hypothetical protein